MAVALNTFTFWHADPTGGPARASSVVGPSTVDPGTAHERVMAETGYAPAKQMQRATLDFPVAHSVRQVIQRYDGCGRCHLCATRQSIVHYRGSLNATVAFFGEAPGREENEMGEPFVGASGRLQTTMNRFNSIPEEHVVWMNAVGCRPAPHWEKDRPPTKAELAACSERALMMFTALRPRVIICLGETATKYFFDEKPNIWSYTKFVPQGHPEDWVMVGFAYHPAYLVRTIGIPDNYRQFAAQRTFYSILNQQIPHLTKVKTWRFAPRYSALTGPEVAWHKD